LPETYGRGTGRMDGKVADEGSGKMEWEEAL